MAQPLDRDNTPLGGKMEVVRQGGDPSYSTPAADRRPGSGPGVWLLVTLSSAILLPNPATAETRLSGRRSPLKADASRATRENAVQSIPYQKLDQRARAKIDAVLDDTTIFRRLPVQVIQCDPQLYLFLVEHPDVVVAIWRVFGVTQLAVRETGPDTFRVAEEGGTTGTMDLLYASHDTHVFYAEGRCEGPVLAKPIQGRVLVVLKSGYVHETDGHDYVTCRLDAFLQVDRAGVELVTKTFQPVVGRVADLNFAQTAGFLASLSRTAATNPSGVLRLASKLSEVQPPVRQRFAELAEQVAEKAAPHAGDLGPAHVAEQSSVGSVER